MRSHSIKAWLFPLQPPLAWGLTCAFSLSFGIVTMATASELAHSLVDRPDNQWITRAMSYDTPLVGLVPLGIFLFALTDRLLRRWEPVREGAGGLPPGRVLFIAQSILPVLAIVLFWACEWGYMTSRFLGWELHLWCTGTLAGGLLLTAVAEVLTAFGFPGGKWAPAIIPVAAVLSLLLLIRHVEGMLGTLVDVLPMLLLWPSPVRIGLALAAVLVAGVMSLKWEYSLRRQVDSTPVVVGAAVWVLAGCIAYMYFVPNHILLASMANRPAQDAGTAIVIAAWALATGIRIVIHLLRRRRPVKGLTASRVS